MKRLCVVLAGVLTGLIFPGGTEGAARGSGRVAPPAGITIGSEDRAELEGRLAELGAAIQAARTALAKDPALAGLLPDVEVFHKAVRFALEYDGFFRSNEVGIARRLLEQGLERAQQLRSGAAPWLSATGLVVRGYRSRIDDSIQPYGLLVPSTWRTGSSHRHRLDVWLHGRDDHLSELKFLYDRQRNAGEFQPADGFVLHPYGRFCNAFKFAGETDVLEALDQVRKQYPIDERRIALRGFSMGGAGCWHLAVHYADRWCAAAPGAGFAETAQYTHALERSPLPPWFEQKLWHLYDATDYAANLFNCPTVAYSGELDPQRQAAEIMTRAAQAEGVTFEHLIGPGVRHAYEPGTKAKLAARIDELVAQGRPVWPPRVRWTSWTLRYNTMAWVTVDRLSRHWERATLEAEATAPGIIRIQTTNVAALHLRLDDAHELLRGSGPAQIVIDGSAFTYRGWPAARDAAAKGFERKGSSWSAPATSLSSFPPPKRSGLQGPIDDAFMDGFLFVRPTGQAFDAKLGERIQLEMTRAAVEWRNQFRGEVRMKDDAAVTEEDMRHAHLILWGDPRSNRLWARLGAKLPLHWDASEMRLGGRTFDPATHVPALVYPNPLNPSRYVVLNSGFTFWEAGQASNALQTPKLPDFAVFKVDPADTTAPPGRVVVHAGFFGENWEELR